MKYGKCIYNHGITQARGNNKFSNAEISIMKLKLDTKNVSAELEKVLNEKDISSNLSLNVKQLLNHCVGIHRTYSEIYNQKEVFYRIMNEELIKYGRELIFKAEVKCSREDIVTLESQGYTLRTEEGKTKVIESYIMPSSRVTRKCYYELARILRDKGIWYYIGTNGYVNYLSASNISRYSPEFIIYNVMFYLGSITRYYPYLFDEIFSAKEQWLMGEFLTTQPKQFIYLTTAKILSQDVLKAYADF